jgi:hypothetical protein
MIAVLRDAAHAPGRPLSWVDINRLAARWLRPQPGAETADTSRLGHAVVVEMARHGLLEADLTSAADGSLMVRTALHLAGETAAADYRLAA